MIVQIIGYWCLIVFILSQFVLSFAHKELKDKASAVHIASGIYALVAAWCFK